MNHAITTPELARRAPTSPSAELAPAAHGVGLVEALGLVARHVAFIHAGERAGRNRVALDLVAADIDRVLGAAGLARRVDDRGDEWAELDGSPVAWLGHRAEVSRSAVYP